MNNYKNLKKVGIAVIALSLIAILFNFFNMYSLVGNCPNGTEDCSAYSQWQLINKLGIFGLVAGIILTAYGIVKLRRNK